MALQSTGQGADQIQTGSQAQRPPLVSPGLIRFNTNTQDLELYEGGKWVSMRPPVEHPIRDNNREIGLNYNRGLTLTGANLEALLGDGLGFTSSGEIRLIADGDIAIAYEPLVASVTPARREVTKGGPITSDLPGNEVISVTPPAESNAGLAFAAVKVKVESLQQAWAYPVGEPGNCWAHGTFEAGLSGRNCFAYTAGVQNRMGASFGGSCAFDVGSGGQGVRDSTWDVWIIKMEELRWDKNKTEPINFTFTWPYWTRNTCVIEYGNVRMSVSPYQLIY